MEKLIELLNEYERCIKGSYSERTEEEIKYKINGADLIVISKSYGFIQWLVQNLKFDMDKVRKKGYITNTYDLDEPGEGYCYLDRILMLLAIQDEPIKFLISILK